MDDEYLHGSGYQNFVSVYRGLSYVGKVLEPYTQNGLQKMHQKIYRNNAGRPPCTRQCSKTFGEGNLTRWCTTCKRWRAELLKRCQRRQYMPQNTQSWEWPTHYEHIINLFLPENWASADINLQDISTMCNIWDSCKQFHIRHCVIKRVKRMRNKYYGHNPNLSVTDQDRAEVFDALRDLLNDPDVGGHIVIADNIRQLNRIEQGSQLQAFMDAIKTRLDLNDDRFARVENCEKTIAQTVRDIVKLKETESEQREANHRKVITEIMRNRTTRHISYTLPVCSVILSVLLYYTQTYYSVVKSSDCLSEMYSIPFPQDLPLYGYIRDSRQLIGREWLFEDLEHTLFNLSFTKSGMVVIADMGYGKSAIVSHILCADAGQKGWKLRQQTVAFHVCQYDNPSTQKPGRFIRRLVGFLSSNSAEFGSIISLLDTNSILYDLEKCDQEREACFDQGIALPLKQLKNVPEIPWLIVVDALDECLDKQSNKNPIQELLSSRASKWPKWIKLLITSRNSSQNSNLKRMLHLDLHSEDSRNVKDIKLYIEEAFTARGYTITSKQYIHKINNLVKRSDGNFLYITHALQYQFDHGEHQLPSTLGEMYELNFERQFATPNSFQLPKAILEIMCSCMDSLNKSEILRILKFNNVSGLENIDQSWEKLVFFLKPDRSVVSLAHQSIHEWLTGKENDLFFISMNIGHKHISKYLFNLIETNKTHDVVNLAIHVAKSNDDSLIKMFTSLKDPEQYFDLDNSTLHRLIYTTDSVQALNLLLHYIHVVDSLNKGGIPASFVAAATGHLGQLKRLVDKGANVSFTISNKCEFFTTDLTEDSSLQIESIKNEYLCGYNILHIAAKYGRLKVAKYLIKSNNSLVKLENSIGLRASDIACENGYDDLLETIAKENKDVLDSTCLHHAAENDHEDIIKIFIKKGIQIECISDTDSSNTLKEIQNSFFHRGLYARNMYFALIDKWWHVLRETPLHVAIRSGNTITAKLLIQAFPALLECYDAFGSTPFLSSIIYNNTDVFIFMLDRIHKDKCEKVSTHLSKLSASLLPYYHMCPFGASFVHLVAIYDRFEMILHVYPYRKQFNWNEKENTNYAPIHYAASRSNFRFAVASKRLQDESLIDMDIRTNNGSSAFHLVVLSRSYSVVHAMTDAFQKKISYVKDNENRGMFHNLAMYKMEGFVSKDDSDAHGFDLSIYNYLIDMCMHTSSLDDTDVHGRNVMHYSLCNGHMVLANLTLNSHAIVFKSMLDVKDASGFAPVDYAIRNIDVSKRRHMVLPETCTYFEVFFMHCSEAIAYDHILTSFELGLVIILQNSDLSEFHPDFMISFHNIILSSPYLTTAVLVYYKEVQNEDIRKHLLESLKTPTPLLKYSIIATAHFRPEILHQCGKHISTSPLHAMVLNVEHRYTIFNMELGYINQFMTKVFGQPIELDKLNCVDAYGFNMLHYALLGGNICTAKFLLQRKIAVTNKRVSLTDVPMLALSARLIEDRSNFIECFDTYEQSVPVSEINQVKSTDDFLANYFFLNKHDLKYRDFCKSEYKEISLVHLLAANGMINSLRYISDMFGNEIISCNNVDGFTPLYFGHLFNETDVVRYIEISSKLHYPTKLAEYHIIFKFLHGFPPSNNFTDTLYCLTQIRFTSNPYLRIRYFKCILNATALDKEVGFIDLSYSDITVMRIVSVRLMKSLFNFHPIITNYIRNKRPQKRSCKRFSSVFSHYKQFILLHITLLQRKVAKRKMSKPILKLFTAFKNTLKSTTLNDIANCSISLLHKQTLKHMRVLLECLMNKILTNLKDAYIHDYLLLKKPKYMKTSDKFHFFNERMNNFKFNEDSFRKSPTSLSRRMGQTLSRFKYLDIFRKTLVYKQFSKYVFEDTFAFFSKYLTVEFLEHTSPKRPFEELENVEKKDDPL